MATMAPELAQPPIGPPSPPYPDNETLIRRPRSMRGSARTALFHSRRFGDLTTDYLSSARQRTVSMPKAPGWRWVTPHSAWRSPNAGSAKAGVAHSSRHPWSGDQREPVPCRRRHGNRNADPAGMPTSV